MSRNPTGLILSFIITATGALMLLPAMVDLVNDNDDWEVFALSAAVAGFAGVSLNLGLRFEGAAELTIRNAFLLTVSAWTVVPALAALPFLGAGLDYSDAFFEAMSGLTTTGATVLAGLDDMPLGILLWRAILQWIGGIGIIVMAILLLPLLRIGGMQLFRIESSEKGEKATASAIDFVKRIAAIYVIFTLLCAILYATFGMSKFDAICHAMSTVSTGGFATHDASMAYFDNPAIHWTAIAFMLAGASPFIAFIQMTTGRLSALHRHPEFRVFVAALAAISLALGVWLALARDFAPADALRHATFNIVSIVTTTGYASADYASWGNEVLGLVFVLTFMGGCAGSTSGGIKIYRLQVMVMMMLRQMKILISPRRIVNLTYNGRDVDNVTLASISAFFAAFFATFAMVSVALTMTGLDFVTAASGAATALANVGPGLGDMIGPAGNFAGINDTAKWILAAAMLLGRLEFLSVLVMLQPAFWR